MLLCALRIPSFRPRMMPSRASRNQNVAGAAAMVSQRATAPPSRRTARQAPDVDGQVYIASAPEDVEIGQVRRLLVTQAGDYDLVGKILT